MNNKIRDRLSQISEHSSAEDIKEFLRFISENQKPFDWMGWTFGQRVIRDDSLVYQMSIPNLLRLLVMFIRLERFVEGSFDKSYQSGFIQSVIERLKILDSDGSHNVVRTIDPRFDVRADSNLNSDPDSHSETLRQYHKLLWSKPLPSGDMLSLSDNVKGKYLFHCSSKGEFNFTSDSITHTYHFVKKMEHIVESLDFDEKRDIYDQFHLPGGYIIFPGDRVKGFMTINGARGCDQRVVDRFDLTLECIRRFYKDLSSPLSPTLDAYKGFFNLFESFEGYVEFFLLDDLIDKRSGSISFFLPFDDSFPMRPFPKDMDEYKKYISNGLNFIKARTERMVEYSNQINNLTL